MLSTVLSDPGYGDDSEVLIKVATGIGGDSVAPDPGLLTLPMSFATATGFAAMVGLFLGVVDAFLVAQRLLGARGGIDYVPWTMWPASMLAWIVVAGTFGALISVIRPLRRWVVPIALVFPSSLLLGVRILLYRYQLLGHPRLLIPVAIALTVFAAIGVYLVWAWLHNEGLRRVMRHSLYVTLPLAVCCALVLLRSTGKEPSAASSALTPEAGRNVVLIFLDTLRYDYSGIGEGGAWAPNLRSFSREGVRFQWAMAPAPWTLPSHVSVMTGISEWALGLTPQHQVVKEYTGTLPKRFARRGYDTAAFIANPILHDHTGFEAGMRTYDYPRRSLDFCRTAIGVIAAKLSFTREVCAWSSFDVSQRALRYIEGARKPYFLTLNYFDPHDPYWLPPRFPASGARRLSMADHAALVRVLAKDEPLSAQDRARILSLYGQAVHGMDQSMKPLLERLARDVDDGKTIVAIVADHGEHFGEHNLCGHGNSVYAAVLRVPLVIRAKGLDAAEVATPVSVTGLFQVLRQLSKRKSGASESTASVVDLFTAQPPISHIGFGDQVRGATDLWSAVGDGYHLIEADARRELYDIVRDPNETRELIREGHQPPQRLIDMLAQAQWKSGPRQNDRFENLKGIGYLP